MVTESGLSLPFLLPVCCIYAARLLPFCCLPAASVDIAWRCLVGLGLAWLCLALCVDGLRLHGDVWLDFAWFGSTWLAWPCSLARLGWTSPDLAWPCSDHFFTQERRCDRCAPLSRVMQGNILESLGLLAQLLQPLTVVLDIAHQLRLRHVLLNLLADLSWCLTW